MMRDAASMGLAPFYKIIGSPVRRTIQLLGALAFVPEGDVYDVYIRSSPNFQMMSESSLSTLSLLGSVVLVRLLNTFPVNIMEPAYLLLRYTLPVF